MKVLVTGAAGFVGGYLAREFPNDQLLLCDIAKSDDPKITKLNVADAKEASEVISGFGPDQIYHLAAIPSPRFASEELIQKVNVEGTRNILEACRKSAPKARVILVSSGYVYGECVRPAEESDELAPQGAYANSKADMERMAVEEFSDLDFVIARPFNHSGKGQKLGTVFPDLSAQIDGLPKDGKGTIKTFDLDNERDFLHVKDVVKAYKLLARKGKRKEVYNICSGKAVSIREILNKILERRAIQGAQIYEQKLSNPLKKSYGSNKKMMSLGWLPKYSLDDIVGEFSK